MAPGFWNNPLASITNRTSPTASRQKAGDEESAGHLLAPESHDEGLHAASTKRGRRSHRTSPSIELQRLEDDPDAIVRSQPAVEDEGIPGHPAPGWSRRRRARHDDRPRSHFRVGTAICVSCPSVMALFSCLLLVIVLICILLILLGYFDPTASVSNGSPSLSRLVASYPLLHPDSADYPTSSSRDIRPLPLHSHNDYWRAVPLYTALSYGCVSVEADIWSFPSLSPSPTDLLVGHSLSSLTPQRTLRSLYIDPLEKILTTMNPSTRFTSTSPPTRNGVFDTDPKQSLALIIDLKPPVQNASTVIPLVLAALEPLRTPGWLTTSNGTHRIPGPVTVVLTGNTPFEQFISSTSGDGPDHRDVFFDAPLEAMTSDEGTNYTSLNSFYASTSLLDAVGPIINGTLNVTQLEKVRKQVQGAHARGLKARYWDVPEWGPGIFDKDEGVWAMLGREMSVRAGEDVFSVDDLEGFKRWGGLHH